MGLLGIDVGTTNCKAGLFNPDGSVVHLASRPTILRHSPEGVAYYEPEELWGIVLSVIREVTLRAESVPIAGIGIASMAETGLLLDRTTCTPRCNFVPWFETCSAYHAQAVSEQADAWDRFCKTGIRSSHKTSLAKLLWLRARDEAITRHAVWLSAADYILFRLTGAFATDYSLAGRTDAFRIDRKCWEQDWIRSFGLEPELFPPALPSVARAGTTRGQFDSVGLQEGISVSVAGHDHVCAAVGVGITEPGPVLDSIGTAEALVGTLAEGQFTESQFRSGLDMGCYPVQGQYHWMGGLLASGGSVEWLRSILGVRSLSYQEVTMLLDRADSHPTGIFYFPYLLDRGAGTLAARTKRGRAAIIGLEHSHGRAELVKAILEGTAYEFERLTRTAKRDVGVEIASFIATGGGTRNRRWMQIKADVSGARYDIAVTPEATLLGAALIAGVGCGMFSNIIEAVAAAGASSADSMFPDAERHQIYTHLFEHGYLPLSEIIAGDNIQ
jgi:xylulokinase